MAAELSKSNLDDFTTKELLDWYNANSGEEAVKRFSDRAAAERRIVALLEKKAGGTTTAPETAAPIKLGKKQVTAPVKAKRVPKEKKPAKTAEQRSAAVKNSWEDGKVRKARSARHNVRVDGTLYESVLKAFIALKLDTKPHQRVRREVVASGKTEHEGHKFILAPKED